MRDGLRDTTYSFGPSLSEHHSSVSTDVLGVLNEPEQAGGFVSRTKVLSVHGDNGCSLSSATTVNWREMN